MKESFKKVWRLRSEYLTHVFAPAIYLLLCYLTFVAGLWSEAYMAFMMTVFFVVLVFVNYVVYNHPPKRYRASFYVEQIPMIGFGIVFDDIWCIVLPYICIGIDFRDVYKFKLRTL